jgi:Flp pilus assembly protein TadD
MLKQFTSGTLFLLCLSVAGCAQMPLGPSETVTAPAEHTLPLADEPMLTALPMPQLHTGSQELFDSAVNLLREGRLDGAQMLFEKLTVKQPERAGPWVNLGYIHLARGEQKQAQVALSQALVANPNNCDALNQMGVLARRDGRFEEAEKLYRRCLAVAPSYVSARLNLAILYELYMGRLGEALAAYMDYQLMLSEPDSKVGGWVMDLERRVAAVATR